MQSKCFLSGLGGSKKGWVCVHAGTHARACAWIHGGVNEGGWYDMGAKVRYEGEFMAGWGHFEGGLVS